MATLDKEWVGSASSDWNTAGNWNPAGVPSGSQNVLFNQGAVSVTGDATVGGTVVLGNVIVTSGYTGSIGTSGTYLPIDCASLRYSGGGAASYFDCDITDVYVDDGAGGASMLNFNDSLGAGTVAGGIDNLYINGGSGTVNLGNSMVVDNIYLTNADGITLNIGTGISSFDLIQMDSGNVVSDSCSATLDIKMTGGLLTMRTSSAAASEIEMRGGTCRWKCSSGAASLLMVDGLFDLRGNQNRAGPVFTAANLYGGVVNEQTGLLNVTWTAVNIRSRDAKILWDTGRALSA